MGAAVSVVLAITATFVAISAGDAPAAGDGTQAASKVCREVMRPLAMTAMSIPRTAGGPLGGPNLHGSAAAAPARTYSGPSGAKMNVRWVCRR
jgi:hypothetical protein